MNYLKQIIRGQRPLIDVWHYFVGHYRYILYYSKFSFLIRKYIREQISYRIELMNPTCYEEGNCIHCGCQTTALQMANKVCEGKCYPEFLTKQEWNKLPIWIKQMKSSCGKIKK